MELKNTLHIQYCTSSLRLFAREGLRQIKSNGLQTFTYNNTNKFRNKLQNMFTVTRRDLLIIININTVLGTCTLWTYTDTSILHVRKKEYLFNQLEN